MLAGNFMRDHLWDPNVYGRQISNGVLKNQAVIVWTEVNPARLNCEYFLTWYTSIKLRAVPSQRMVLFMVMKLRAAQKREYGVHILVRKLGNNFSKITLKLTDGQVGKVG
jgi:hypothetical protein